MTDEWNAREINARRPHCKLGSWWSQSQFSHFYNGAVSGSENIMIVGTRTARDAEKFINHETTRAAKIQQDSGSGTATPTVARLTLGYQSGLINAPSTRGFLDGPIALRRAGSRMNDQTKWLRLGYIARTIDSFCLDLWYASCQKWQWSCNGRFDDGRRDEAPKSIFSS